jgi:general secretion pathway protein G
MRSRRRTRGFTLIEVMLVLAILVGLVALGVFTMGGSREKAKKDMTKIRIQKVKSSLQRYLLDVDGYPSEEEGGLQALVKKPSFDDEKKAEKWAGPYAEAEELKDDWGNDLKFELVEDEETQRQVPHISSSGPDGEEGTDDDLKSWSEDEKSL